MKHRTHAKWTQPEMKILSETRHLTVKEVARLLPRHTISGIQAKRQSSGLKSARNSGSGPRTTLSCPSCSGRLHVYDNLKGTNSIIRARRCNDCGKKFRTEECFI